MFLLRPLCLMFAVYIWRGNNDYFIASKHCLESDIWVVSNQVQVWFHWVCYSFMDKWKPSYCTGIWYKSKTNKSIRHVMNRECVLHFNFYTFRIFKFCYLMIDISWICHVTEAFSSIHVKHDKCALTYQQQENEITEIYLLLLSFNNNTRTCTRLLPRALQEIYVLRLVDINVTACHVQLVHFAVIKKCIKHFSASTYKQDLYCHIQNLYIPVWINPNINTL